MTHSSEPKPASEVVSPKVIASAVTGAALTIVGAGVLGAVQAITPEHFAALGIWGAVIYGAVVAAGAALAGYIKGDPRRV